MNIVFNYLLIKSSNFTKQYQQTQSSHPGYAFKAHICPIFTHISQSLMGAVEAFGGHQVAAIATVH